MVGANSETECREGGGRKSMRGLRVRKSEKERECEKRGSMREQKGWEKKATDYREARGERSEAK